MKFEWEELSRNVHSDYKEFVERTKIQGGWLIRSMIEMLDDDGERWISSSQSMVFIPDPEHLWEIDEE